MFVLNYSQLSKLIINNIFKYKTKIFFRNVTFSHCNHRLIHKERDKRRLGVGVPLVYYLNNDNNYLNVRKRL